MTSLPQLPTPRGPLTEYLLAALVSAPGPLMAPPADVDDPLGDDDLQLALYACYELAYRGFDGVDAGWEWEPSLIAFRRSLERAFEDALVDRVPRRRRADVAPEDMDVALREIEASDDGPSLSRYIEREADLEQVREFLIHRSAYQLKEADPHSWAIPRLSGAPKAAIVEIQADEYGGGRAERIHAQLFADTLETMGLDPTYGAYVDRLPGVTLATVNLMSLCGLNRRLRGAIVGHLALFEMTSSIPNRRYGDALRRLGYGPAATEFFDEHVVADAVHENIAAVDLAGGLARMEPALTGDILWGAQALLDLDARWSAYVLDAWASGASSLRPRSSSPLGALNPSSL